MQNFKYYISFLTWPALMLSCIAITAFGFNNDFYPMVMFNVAYFFLIISLVILERLMPHEPMWREHDKQTLADIAHSLSSKATVQGLLIFGGAIGLTELITPLSETDAYGIWPREWPILPQVLLALVAAELGLYWAHRFGHEWPIFWRFHAIHHSVTRLWVINTGRFHFIDSLVSIIFAMVILLALGAPIEIVRWQAAMTAFFGLLTHCNVEMRFGPLNYFFVTPAIHRWHHSMQLDEGNKNYGENIIIWDIIFGTYVNKPSRPPKYIGIPEYMPPKFRHQFLWPFISGKRKKEIAKLYPDLGAQAKARMNPELREALEAEHKFKLSHVLVPRRWFPWQKMPPRKAKPAAAETSLG